ncbi:LysR family transcriptional regulator [Kordiimonas lacus]|uniref:Transcriptional regulator n=1 Tax=Kordiimonas lacus TaxID=637679 RepID=A0A1G6T152_9PROT|nr:LysR family transcriptional regulator [Kordiimonas lacus]SDD22266.1 transcriptional regulator [Kordiimonas lacus]
MDITQARTFLAVLETGTFLGASDRVNVAQSTVSSRIKALEQMLGQELFTRNKTGAVPTRAGLAFARHARAIQRQWDQAKLSLALPEGQQKLLTIGGQPSLWDGFLLHWLPWMRQNASEVAVRAQMIASSSQLMQQLVDDTLDLVVLYRPEARPGTEIRQIFEEQLVLVSSSNRPDDPGGLGDAEYVYVDWGPEFEADHALNFPDAATPPLNLNVGSLGISFLLNNAAAGYFPMRIAAPYIAAGSLVRVPDAPTFTYPVYAAFPEDRDSALIGTVLSGLRQIAAENSGVSAGTA